MLTAEIIDAVAPEAFKEVKALEAQNPLKVGSDVIWLTPEQRLGGHLTVDDGEKTFVSAFIITELDDRTAMIKGVFRGQDAPASVRVRREEIVRFEPFFEYLFRTMHEIGVLTEDESKPKN